MTTVSYSFGQRVTAATLAAITGIQLSGCATGPTEGEIRLRNQEIARIARGHDWLKGQASHLGTLSVQGHNSPVYQFEWVAPGRHLVDVPATWSNKFEDRTQLAVDVQAGKKYVVLIYEMAAGENRARIEIRPRTFGESLLADKSCGAGYFCAMLLLVALPFIISDLSKGPPKGRPFDGCCFVWIQDEDSGQVVAGASPLSKP